MSEFEIVEKKLASKEGSYWGKKGDFQEQYDKIWKQYIPSSGKGKTPEAELVRAFSALYYDCYNNGWGNNKLDEIEELIKNQSKFKPYYKGKANLDGLLKRIEMFQDAFENMSEDNPYVNAEEDDDGEVYDYEVDNYSIQNDSKRLVEPHLDDLGDAIIQYAYEKLFTSKEASSKTSAIQSTYVKINYPLDTRKVNAAGFIGVKAPMGVVLLALKLANAKKKNDIKVFYEYLKDAILQYGLKDKAGAYIDTNPNPSLHEKDITFNIEGDDIGIYLSNGNVKHLYISKVKNTDPLVNKLI